MSDAKKAPRKTTAKRITALRRPEGNEALLNNPALSGIKETVSRSYIGGGQGVIPAPSTPDDALSPESVAPESSPEAEADDAKSAAVHTAPEAEPVQAQSSGAEVTHVPSSQAHDLTDTGGDRSTPTDVTTEPARVNVTVIRGDQPRAGENEPAGTDKPRDSVAADGPRSEATTDAHVTTAGNQLGATEAADSDEEAHPPTATEQAEAEPADTESADGKKRSGPRVRRRQSAQQVLERSYTESVIDLRLRKKEWAAHPFRFTPDQISQMNTRAAEDSADTGLPLTSAQYVNAAMAMYLPVTLDEQLGLAEAFLRDMGTRRIPEGQQSSYRVSPEVLDIVRPLSNHLKAAGKARTAYHIYSAVLARFLKDLAAEGPLKFEN
ncbi:hypothetical protein ACWD3I_25285 [Streptomyces sp. NPDC002817]|uniref:hypothetical protein n=1 Tax=Streptomyces sp. NPDC088357 TaxID=3154655 RepID=UPI00343E9302